MSVCLIIACTDAGRAGKKCHESVWFTPITRQIALFVVSCRPCHFLRRFRPFVILLSAGLSCCCPVHLQQTDNPPVRQSGKTVLPPDNRFGLNNSIIPICSLAREEPLFFLRRHVACRPAGCRLAGIASLRDAPMRCPPSPLSIQNGIRFRVGIVWLPCSLIAVWPCRSPLHLRAKRHPSAHQFNKTGPAVEGGFGLKKEKRPYI